MHRLATALTVTAVLIALAAPAHAKDMSGKMGIGVEGTLGFRPAPSVYFDSSAHQVLRLPAFSFVYPVSPLFHVQALAGAAFAAGSGSDAAYQLGVTLRGIYMGIILSEVVHLTIPFGLGYTLVAGPSTDFQGNASSTTNHYFHLEVALRPEWFITDYISVHTQAGAVISLLTGGQSIVGPAYDPGVGVTLFANTNLLAQAGFTVWFQ